MYVVWLSPGGSGGFTGIFPGCRDMSWLSSTSGSSRHCCILGERALGSMMKQWRSKVKGHREGSPHWHDYRSMVRVMVGGGH